MSNKNSPMCDVTGKRTKHGHEDPAPQNNSLLWKFGSWAIIIIIVIVIATLIFLFFKSKPVQPIQPIYSKFGKLIVEEIRLGEGKFGDVRSGTLNDTKAAIKLLKGIPSESQMKAFFLECDIMQHLDHKNIIQCRGCSTGEFLIILEYASKGALGSFLRSKKPQSTQMELMAYATQVANGLAYLHAKHIVHRDLAARNILVFDKNLIKIADFGLARRLSKEYYVPSGREYFPVNWTAPEAIKHNCFSKKTDIWSYGVLLWEIFKHGSEPYRIECHKLKAGERLVQPPGCSSFMYNIMLSCWCYNPDNRPEITEIVDILSR